MRKPVFGFPTRSDANRAVDSHRRWLDSVLKFLISEVMGLYHLCSENKGADQLRNYCAADLQLCFCICKRQVFS